MKCSRGSCGKESGVYVYCEEHRRRAREQVNGVNAWRHRQGMCCRCKSPWVGGRLRCERCSAEINETNLARYWELRRAGVCVSCGHVESEPGRSRCGDCLEKAAGGQRRYRERKRAGQG